MSDCKHEPWMQPPQPNMGLPERPWDVSGMLKPPAYVCRHCDVVYVPAEIREAFQRNAEETAQGKRPTVGSTIASAIRRRKKEPDA